jgi:hypothetical protein
MNTRYSTFKFFTSPEKEEVWLEQMALRGLFLSKVSSFYCYSFAQGVPEKRAYKIDYRSFRNPSDREDYLAMFNDSGWQAAMPREANGAFYFSRSQEGAYRDIFSDDVSRAQRNLRYASLSAYTLIPAFLPMLVLYLTGNIKFSNIGYLTPGLWEMTGTEFVFHFLFETPFVLLRSSAYLLPLAPVTLALVFLLRYFLIYRKAARQQAI